MSTESKSDGPNVAVPGDHQIAKAGLAAGSVGLVAVLFMAVANAAPITAMTFNVPIAIGYGNGTGASSGFLFATIVLTIFTIGFISMARHITTTGAFMGFISHGLGQIPGMAAGVMATVAYVIFEGSLIGGFAYFASDALSSSLNISINWLPIALIGAIVITLLTYFKITLAASVLGVTLVAEVVLLLALALSVVFKPGPDGLGAGSPFNIANGFAGLEAGAFGTQVAAGTAALGIFFAFWSWIGFETTAVYGEESKDPKTIVPRATLIAVIGLGLFYTFLSWMVVAGNGNAAAVELSASATPVELWQGLVSANLGTVFLGLYKILVVVGSFACAMAFHNAASRYIYAIGREAPSESVRRTVGGTHPVHGSPAVASFIQTGITLVLLLAFFFFTAVNVPNADTGVAESTPALVPYVNVYGLLALIGTAMILIVQTACSIAVISYFWVRKVHKGNVITTLICPLIGALGMIYVLVLLFQNLTFAAGLASDSLIVKLLPFELLLAIGVGVGYALWMRAVAPERYNEIGRTVLEEAHERV